MCNTVYADLYNFTVLIGMHLEYTSFELFSYELYSGAI